MSTTPQLPVLVGVDGVRGRSATVDLAAAEARRRRVPLSIVHVWPGRFGGPLGNRGAAVTTADGLRLLELAAQRVHREVPGVEVRTRLVDGAAARTLARLSTDAQLLVVGHRDDLLTRHGWGSTAVYLAHHAACPLLVDRGTTPVRGPVVLAASAREPTTATVACAFEQASLRGAPLVAVHVWSQGPDEAGSALPPASAGYAAAHDEADRMLAEALAGWCTRYPDVQVRRLVLHDLDLAYTLGRAASRGRLFVAGSGRHGRFSELLYGSVDGTMLRSSACPVLLIPTHWPRPAQTQPAQTQPAGHGGRVGEHS